MLITANWLKTPEMKKETGRMKCSLRRLKESSLGVTYQVTFVWRSAKGGCYHQREDKEDAAVLFSIIPSLLVPLRCTDFRQPS